MKNWWESLAPAQMGALVNIRFRNSCCIGWSSEASTIQGTYFHISSLWVQQGVEMVFLLLSRALSPNFCFRSNAPEGISKEKSCDLCFPCPKIILYALYSDAFIYPEQWCFLSLPKSHPLLSILICVIFLLLNQNLNFIIALMNLNKYPRKRNFNWKPGHPQVRNCNTEFWYDAIVTYIQLVIKGGDCYMVNISTHLL